MVGQRTARLETTLKTSLRGTVLAASLAVFLSGMTAPLSAKEVFVDTPSLCCSVRRVEGANVYIERSPSACPPGTGKARAVVKDDTVQEVALYVDGTYWEKQYIGPAFDTGAVEAMQEKARRLKLPKGVAKNTFEKQGQAAAEETHRYYQSDEFQGKLAAERKRLAENVFAVSEQPYYKDYRPAEQGKSRILGQNERVYIFISQSVPLETLRRYAADIEKIGDPSIILVMRGFVDGARLLKPTAGFIAGILKKDPGCELVTGKCSMLRTGVNVDPMLFSRYAIAKVPAVVYVPRIDILNADMSEGDAKNAAVQDFYALYGDAALDYALERIQAASGRQSVGWLVQALRKGFY